MVLLAVLLASIVLFFHCPIIVLFVALTLYVVFNASDAAWAGFEIRVAECIVNNTLAFAYIYVDLSIEGLHLPFKLRSVAVGAHNQRYHLPAPVTFRKGVTPWPPFRQLG